MDASAVHVVLLAECFLIPTWFLALYVFIMLTRDYFFPRPSGGGGVARIHGVMFVLQYQHSYHVSFVPFSIMMKLVVSLARGIALWMTN
jgi:hypothetical protein